MMDELIGYEQVGWYGLMGEWLDGCFGGGGGRGVWGDK